MQMQQGGRGYAYLFEMGCGKTLTAIATMGVLYRRGLVRKVLVIAPTSVVSVWPKELEESAAFAFACAPLLGEKERRLRTLDALQRTRGRKCLVAAINVESIWREGILDALLSYDADLVIVDESQRIKTHDAAQSKAAHKLGDKARYKLMLTGTPVQNRADDLWSQYRFLDRTVFGDNFYRFRGRYCQMGGFGGKQVVGYRNMDELVRKEYSVAYRVTKADALDLPEQTFETRTVPLSPAERKAYDQMRRESVAELEGMGQVTATTVLTRLLRLQQIAGGFLSPDGEEGGGPVQVGTSKLDALRDIVEDYVVGEGRKLVVFAKFIPEVGAILKMLEKALPAGMRAVSIQGSVRKEERGAIMEAFQTDPGTVVIVGQIDTLGTGVTLTAADTCVYFSKTYNYSTWEQSLSRIHRIGQRNTCLYIDLVAENTVDETIVRALEKKEDLARTVVDNWREVLA